MEVKKDLVVYEARDGQQISLSFETIKKYLIQGHPEYVTSQEMMYFMGTCKSRGLNPFIKDCYLIKYSQKDAAAIITSIDYFRKRAKAQKDCKGWTRGIIIERNGEIIYSDGLMLESDTLLGGWFEAQPEGWEKPFKIEVNLKGYLKKKTDGSLTSFWRKENQPSQIAKVAESQGLRTLWPDEFQQLYTPEEIGEGDMFKIAEDVAKSPQDLNDKLKPASKPQDDVYKTQEKAEPEKEELDPVQKLYKGKSKIKFNKFLKSHITSITSMDQKYQEEIRAEHQKHFPGQPYPLAEPLADPPVKEQDLTEDELMVTMVDGAQITPNGIAVSCPNSPQGIHILKSKCEETCTTRENCPTWSKWDRDKSKQIV